MEMQDVLELPANPSGPALKGSSKGECPIVGMNRKDQLRPLQWFFENTGHFFPPLSAAIRRA